jgi:hypothetical protein
LRDRDNRIIQDLIRGGPWSAAAKTLSQTEGRGLINDPVATHLAWSKQETGTQAVLDEAEVALEVGDLAKASAELAHIPDHDLLVDRANALRERLANAVQAKVIEFCGKLSKGLASDMDAPLKLLLAVQPRSVEVDALAALVDVTRLGLTAQGEAHSLLQNARQAFAAGDLFQAQRPARGAPPVDPAVARFVADLERFTKLWSRADLKEVELNELLVLDMTLSANPAFSHFTPPIHDRLGALALRQALADVTANRPEHAQQALLKASKLSSGGDEVQHELRELAKKAKELYLQGYVAAFGEEDDPRQARALFWEAVSITKPEDEFHVKALARLLELGPG